MRHNLPLFVSLAFAFAQLSSALADPTITSPPPGNGVSPSAPLVFTFSEAMNPTNTSVAFFDTVAFIFRPTTQVWSGGNTVLTCTPAPAFPSNRLIAWTATGENPNGDSLSGTTGGAFTTGSGSGGGGFGTNAITTFSVGKIYHYNQTNSGSPVLDPGTPYGFSGVATLASNRTTAGLTLTLPTSSVSNMTQLPSERERYVVFGIDVNLTNYDATFPAGNYTFFDQSASSNQSVVVNLPTELSLPQPGAPHVTNFPATQAVDASQDFVLGWDAFPGGTAADYVDVDIGTNYLSAEPGTPGALSSTNRTFKIPAGTLQSNSNYLSRVGFFRFVGNTNSGYNTAAYRATYTEFTLLTTGASLLVLTNASWTPSQFSFDVLCSNGQTVTVEYTNVLSSGTWTKLLTTNSTSNKFHVNYPQAPPTLFFRARNGP